MQPTRLPRPWDSPGKNTSGLPFPSPMHESESEVAQSCPTLATPWTSAHQAPPSMGFSRQKFWSGVSQVKPLCWQTSFCDRIIHTPATTHMIVSVQFSSVAQSCPTLCDPMNRSTPGLPVHHHLPEFTQAHIHQVGDAIQPSHPLSSPSPPAPNPSHHQSFPNSDLN